MNLEEVMGMGALDRQKMAREWALQKSVESQGHGGVFPPGKSPYSPRSLFWGENDPRNRSVLDSKFIPMKGAPAKYENVGMDLAMPLATVWHGSPHLFKKFNLGKIGSGEGSQYRGHGLYFADKKETAAHYKGKWDRKKQEGVGGNLYRVDLPDEQIDRMILFDEPFEKQPQTVKDAWKKWKTSSRGKKHIKRTIREHYDYDKPYKLIRNPDGHGMVRKYDETWEPDIFKNPSGEDIHSQIYESFPMERDELGNVLQLKPGMFQREAIQSANWLNKNKVPGIKFLDQLSRDAKKGTYNYVKFDDRGLTVEEIIRSPRKRKR